MECVKFNTLEKALNCFEQLGKRGVYIFRFEYKDEQYGYYVYYFRKRG